MYDPTTIRRLTINPIAETELERVAAAMNGLTGEFGQTWVEVTLYGFDLAEESKRTNVSVDVLRDNRTDFEQCVFLWKDLEVLRCLKGFDTLRDKLAVCLKNQDVDVEISVAADLCRLRPEAAVELEPLVDNYNKADSRFRWGPTENWTYVEVTRRNDNDPVKIVNERGDQLAKIVAARDPSLRQFIAMTKPMGRDFSDEEYQALKSWVPNSQPNEEYKDIAFVGLVPHNMDESPLVLPRLPGPCSVRQHADPVTGSFGVAYLHYPDFGAEYILERKGKQAKEGAESLLFIDLTKTHSSQAEWDDRIAELDAARPFSAVITMRNEPGSRGFTRRCNVIETLEPRHPLSAETRVILERFVELRVDMSLLSH